MNSMDNNKVTPIITKGFTSHLCAMLGPRAIPWSSIPSHVASMLDLTAGLA